MEMGIGWCLERGWGREMLLWGGGIRDTCMEGQGGTRALLCWAEDIWMGDWDGEVLRWAVRSWVVIGVGGLIGTFTWCLEIWTWGMGDSPISRSRLETFTRCRCHIGTWDFASDLLESR